MREEFKAWADENPLVSEWLETVEAGSARSYVRLFKEFVDWLGLNGEFQGCSPEVLIDFQDGAQGKDRVKIANKLVLFCKEKSRVVRPGTVKHYKTAARSFFEFHGVSLPKRQIVFDEDALEPTESNMNRDVLMKLVGAAKLRDRTIITICFQGALGWKEFNQFNRSWSKIKPQLEEGKKYVLIENLGARKGKKKSGKTFNSMFGRDGVDLLKKYLEKRGEPKTGEGIFITRRSKRISYRAFDRITTELAVRLGLIQKEKVKGVRYGYGMHELRDAFRTEWQRTPADKELCEFMMGHDVDPNQYLKFKNIPDYVTEQYRLAEPRLSLISNPYPDLVDKEEVTVLREQLEELQENQKYLVRFAQLLKEKGWDKLEKLLEKEEDP